MAWLPDDVGELVIGSITAKKLSVAVINLFAFTLCSTRSLHVCCLCLRRQRMQNIRHHVC